MLRWPIGSYFKILLACMDIDRLLNLFAEWNHLDGQSKCTFRKKHAVSWVMLISWKKENKYSVSEWRA